MGGQQDGVALFVELGNELPQRLAQFHVHTGCRLVEHDDRRPVHQCLGDQHAPLHAARELAHVGPRLVGQPQALQQFVDPGVVVANTKVARLKSQRFSHVEEGVKHQFLRNDAQFATCCGVIGLHVTAHHRHSTAGGAGEAGQDADHGGFARTIGAEQSKELAFFNVQLDTVERQELRPFGAAR